MSEEKKEYSDRELFEIAIKDLVKLAIKSNNIITQGLYKGEVSDQVKETLDLCEAIYNKFVKELNDEEIK